MVRIAAPSLCLILVGCAVGMPPPDGGHDAGRMPFDAGSDDSGPMGDDAGPDAGPIGDDGGIDAGADGGGVDASSDAGADAGRDAGASDAGPAGPTCPGHHVGDTIALDGSSDLAKYPASQRLTPGGPLGGSDEYAITWDRDYLYITLVSGAFSDGFKPIHLYLEVRPSLSPAAASTGKEYSSLTAELPFTATHLVALRRTSLSGGVLYNGVYTPGGAWTTLAVALRDGVDVWAEGTSALSARVPWSVLGCAASIRLTTHVVNGPIFLNEWKDFLPLTATPWSTMPPATPGGGYYEIDLTADPAVSGWTER